MQDREGLRSRIFSSDHKRGGSYAEGADAHSAPFKVGHVYNATLDPGFRCQQIPRHQNASLANPEKCSGGVLGSAQEMAGSLGTVLGRHRGNPLSADQKFCVAVKTSVPFDLVLEAVNPVNGETTLVQVDYNNLPIRCRYCLSTSHLIKNCPSVTGHRRIPRGTKSDRVEAHKVTSGDGGKGTVCTEDKKSISKKIGMGGGGASVSEMSEANQEGKHKSPASRPAPLAIHIASESDKSVELLAKECLPKGRLGGATTSSNVDKLMRPHKTIKKGNTHTKPFMTCELWKACELVTSQALSPKRADFSDINEYNNCCREWRARESH